MRPMLSKGYLYFLTYSILYICSNHAFAIPKSVKPWLGIGIENHPRGVLVTRELPETPAQKAGIKAGDVITSIDSKPMKSAIELNTLIKSLNVGQKVVVGIERGKEKLSLNVFLEVRPDLMSLIKKNEGKAAPSFKLSDLKGKAIDLTDLKGQVVLIKFWATWCPSCRASFPHLDSFIEKNKGKNFKVLTVSNEDVDTQASFFKGKNGNYISLVDNEGKVSNSYMIPALPSYVLVDQGGLVSETAVGSGSYLDGILEKAILLLQSK